MTQFPSSLTRTHELASSNSKSCNNSIRFANSGSFLRLRLRLRISHSGSGLAVFAPAMVYTFTAEWVEIFMPEAREWSVEVDGIEMFASKVYRGAIFFFIGGLRKK